MAAFVLALASLLVIAAGLALDGWMATLPSHVKTSCTESAGVTSCAYAPNPAVELWLGLLIVALGVGLLVIAWKVDRRPSERPRQGWKALRIWGAPLFWLAIIPIAEVPIAFVFAGFEVREPTCQIHGFIGATAQCPVSALAPSVLIPGLLNLVPLRWLTKDDPRTRIAAIIASVLGFAGLVGSLVALFVQGPVIEIDYGIFLPPYPPLGQAGLGFGTDIWLATFIALLAIAKLPLGPAAKPAGARVR